MKAFLTCFLPIAAASSPEWEARYGKSEGCGLEPPYVPTGPNDALSVTFEVDGLQRTFLLHLPLNYDINRPTPLVVSFHGWSMSAQSNLEWMGFTSNMQQENYIVAYPEGKRDCLGQQNCWSSWNAGGAAFNGPDGPGAEGWTCHQSTSNCQACADSCQPLGVCNSQNQRNCNWATCIDDISFVNQLLDKLEAQVCIDRSRIFASGESMGGLMAYQVAADIAHRFAAAAPTVGQPLDGFGAAASNPNEQISILDLHARNDNVVPPGGGQSNDGWFYSGVDAMMDIWGEYNSCSGGSEDWDNPVGSGPGNTNLACVEPASNCGQTGTAVISCAMNGGHFAQIRNFWGTLAYYFFMTHPKTEAWFEANKHKLQWRKAAAPAVWNTTRANHGFLVL